MGNWKPTQRCNCFCNIYILGVLNSTFLFRLTPINPAILGVLGNNSIVLLIDSSVIGMLTCLSFKPVHLDLGKRNIFWKIILLATNDPSSSVILRPSSSIALSVCCKLKPFLTEEGEPIALCRSTKDYNNRSNSVIYNLWLNKLIHSKLIFSIV